MYFKCADEHLIVAAGFALGLGVLGAAALYFSVGILFTSFFFCLLFPNNILFSLEAQNRNVNQAKSRPAQSYTQIQIQIQLEIQIQIRPPDTDRDRTLTYIYGCALSALCYKQQVSLGEPVLQRVAIARLHKLQSNWEPGNSGTQPALLCHICFCGR